MENSFIFMTTNSLDYFLCEKLAPSFGRLGLNEIKENEILTLFYCDIFFKILSLFFLVSLKLLGLSGTNFVVQVDFVSLGVSIVLVPGGVITRPETLVLVFRLTFECFFWL